MSFPLTQLFCGIPPQSISSHVPPVNQVITNDLFILPLLQPTHQSKPDTAAPQAPPRSSALLSPPLQHQANCL